MLSRFSCFVFLGIFKVAFAQECLVSIPSDIEFKGTLSPSTSHGWYGDEHLAALIPTNGKWVGMGESRNFFDKFWWWQKGFSARTRLDSEFKIHATKLDGSGIEFEVHDTTSGYGPGWDALLAGIEFPSPGCWEVTGHYNGSSLVLILEVGSGLDA